MVLGIFKSIGMSFVSRISITISFFLFTSCNPFKDCPPNFHEHLTGRNNSNRPVNWMFLAQYDTVFSCNECPGANYDLILSF